MGQSKKKRIVRELLSSAKMAGKGLGRVGRAVYQNREEIASTAYNTGVVLTGAATATAKGSLDSASHAWCTEDRFKKLTSRLRTQQRAYSEYVQSKHVQWRSLDSILIGGLPLKDLVEQRGVPANIQSAYEAAHPKISVDHSLAEAVKDFDETELLNFVSAVKSKLFELKYVDLLNNDLLPEGYHAVLAEFETNPGWAVKISGPDRATAKKLQAKATDSVSYVQKALAKHPEIDVVTANEVFSQLVLSGAVDDLSANVNKSGILSKEVAGQISDAFMPSTLGLAILAFTSYSEPNKDSADRSWSFGTSAGRECPAWVVESLVAAATGPLWWSGIAAGMGVRWIADSGRVKRERYRELKKQLAQHKKTLKSLGIAGT